MLNVIIVAIWLCLLPIEASAREPVKPLSDFLNYTEENPPYNYSDGDEIKGMAFEWALDKLKQNEKGKPMSVYDAITEKYQNWDTK